MDIKQKKELRAFLDSKADNSSNNKHELKKSQKIKNSDSGAGASQHIFIEGSSKFRQMSEEVFGIDKANNKKKEKSGIKPVEKQNSEALSSSLEEKEKSGIKPAEKQNSETPSSSLEESKKLDQEIPEKDNSVLSEEKNQFNPREDSDHLELLQARKLQVLSKSGLGGMPSSPLQIQLMQSDSLKISQEKISSLEEELIVLGQKNGELLSAGELLKEANQELKIQLEEIEKKVAEEKADLTNEREVLLSALSSAKEQVERLKRKNHDLEKKISGYSYSLSHRENSLEGQIEILKMENSVLQREKDKKIIELKNMIEKNKYSLEIIQKQNQELKTLNENLQKTSHRAVSALRATIFNLEGVQQPTDDMASNYLKLTKKAS